MVNEDMAKTSIIKKTPPNLPYLPLINNSACFKVAGLQKTSHNQP